MSVDGFRARVGVCRFWIFGFHTQS
jgi:hypothetical protein